MAIKADAEGAKQAGSSSGDYISKSGYYLMQIEEAYHQYFPDGGETFTMYLIDREKRDVKFCSIYLTDMKTKEIDPRAMQMVQALMSVCDITDDLMESDGQITAWNPATKSFDKIESENCYSELVGKKIGVYLQAVYTHGKAFPRMSPKMFFNAKTKQTAGEMAEGIDAQIHKNMVHEVDDYYPDGWVKPAMNQSAPPMPTHAGPTGRAGGGQGGGQTPMPDDFEDDIPFASNGMYIDLE